MAQLEVYHVLPRCLDDARSEAVLEGEEAHHLLRVRRARVGEEVMLIDGLGVAWQARLINVEKQRAVFKLLQRYERWREPPVRIHLGLGILKADRFREAVDFAVQLGVSEITPLLTLYAASSLSATRLERARRRAVSASKQSGRGLIPLVNAPKQLEDWCIEKKKGCTGIVFTEQGGSFPEMKANEEVYLAIGCEGGFSREEEDSLKDHGFIPVSLGSRRLRSETAVASAISRTLMTLENPDE